MTRLWQDTVKRLSGLSDALFDAFCILSVAGVWPRFIEPRLIFTSHLTLPIPNLPKALEGVKIAQVSDLHWSDSFSDRFLKKVIRKINAAKADLVLFTGDFLCYAELQGGERLQEALASIKANAGCYFCLGNHDYDKFVTINEAGDYDVAIPFAASNVAKGWKRLFSKVTVTRKVSERARGVRPHAGLVALLQDTPFRLLHNETAQVVCRGIPLNITGLGEHSCGQCLPEIAFHHYDKSRFGIVLSHNPDSLPTLDAYPGDLILCGHTHGGQINLPLLMERFTRMEQMEYIRGLKQRRNRWVYINRGLGGAMPFRWFASPEITLLTLTRGIN